MIVEAYYMCYTSLYKISSGLAGQPIIFSGKVYLFSGFLVLLVNTVDLLRVGLYQNP